MIHSWLSIMPPLFVVGAICITRRLNVSLILGIVSAALIATNGNVAISAQLCAERVIAHFSDVDNIYLYILLIMVSSLIVLLTETGSAAGSARIIGQRMRSKRSAEMSSIFLAFLLSIDDYLSILTVGFVMRPIADRCAVARSKLAYIVHALAGPLVLIIPISTWAAAVLAQYDNAGIGMSSISKIMVDPFYAYLNTIPFVFYSVLLIVSVIGVVYTRTAFGVIGHDEDTITPDKHFNQREEESSKHSLSELFVPIGLLVGGVFFGILYAGGSSIFGGPHSILDAFRNSNQTFLVFCIASFTAFIVSLFISLYKNFIRLYELPQCIWGGFLLIKSSIIMVACASILGSFLRLDLHTGTFVANILLGAVPMCVVPVMVFVVSLLITLATGSAWGTFSLLIPIVVEMIITLSHGEPPVMIESIPLLFPTLGALLSGAACGNHIAPFAETTIMTATSTGIDALDHAKTQFVYAVPVIIGSFVSFLAIGLLYNTSFWMSIGLSLGLGLMVMVMLFYCGTIFLKRPVK